MDVALPSGVGEPRVFVDADGPGPGGVRTVTVTYPLGDHWTVTLVADLGADTESEFSRLEFSVREGGAPVEGINANLLRMVPFRDAKVRVDRALLKAWDDVAPHIPDAYDDLEAYAQLAISYEWFVEQFPGQPLKQMSELSGMNRNTLAARVNRAKAHGFLVRPSRMGQFKASEKAWEVTHG